LESWKVELQLVDDGGVQLNADFDSQDFNSNDFLTD